MRKLVAFTCILFLTASTMAHAVVFFTDGFDYADGQLTSEDPTESGLGDNVSGGLWTAHSGGGTFGDGRYVDVVSGQAELLVDGSEDVNRATGASPSAGETWYYGSIFTVNDTRPNGEGAIDGEYFIHFKNDATGAETRNIARVFIDDPTTAETGFTLELESSSGTGTPPEVPWVNDLDFGTSYAIVASYEFDTGHTRLWVDPVNSNSTSIVDDMPNANALAVDLTALALRQGSSGGNPNHQVLVDKVSIGDDFDEVLAALGAGGGDPDIDGDGDVDGQDFLQIQRDDPSLIGDWEAAYPTPLSAITAVPEPTSIALFGLALAMAPLLRRQRG